MKFRELEEIITKAKYKDWIVLELSRQQLNSLPESIGQLTNLVNLGLYDNQLTSLPSSIGQLISLEWLNICSNQLESLPEAIGQLTNLTELYINDNQLTSLPSSIGQLINLERLSLGGNQLESLSEAIGQLTNLKILGITNTQLVSLPESICQLTNLIALDISWNQLQSLPESICQLTNLEILGIANIQLQTLPESISRLTNLISLDLNNNPLTDLSILQSLPKLESVTFLHVSLSRRYWTKLSEWRSEWLLDEGNAEIRAVLIHQIGYERICQDLDAIAIDNWREYTLLKIEGIQEIYDEDGEEIGREPMLLLKMTCPSTAHLHILRVPPEMVSAEAAITWVNHGIHPDTLAIQT
jgi:leucine-rich repeat protein SHOC2